MHEQIRDPSRTRRGWLHIVLTRRLLVCAVGSLATISVLAGCALPSQPISPPSGIREDAGILSVIVPFCAAETVTSVKLTKVVAESIPDPSWSATGFRGDWSRGIVLGPENWSEVHGSYAGLTSFSVEVYIGRKIYGTGVESQAEFDKMRSLPKGSFLVDGTVMTAADYQASVSAKFPCPTSTP